MSFAYGENRAIYRVMYYDLSNDEMTTKASPNGGSTPVVLDPIFPADAEVGDAIMIQASQYTTGKYGKVFINIDTGVVADQFEGVWEYPRRNGGHPYYDIEWLPLENVSDGTNGFTEAGEKELTFDIPDHWDNYMNPYGVSMWYGINIRFRITAISNMTDGGKTNDIRVLSHEIVQKNDPDGSSFEDFYNAAVELGVGQFVKKSGSGTYIFNIGVKTQDDSLLKASKEQAVFANGNILRCWGKIELGYKDSYGARNGCLIRFEAFDNSLNGVDIAHHTPRKIYDTIIECEPFHTYNFNGIWGGRMIEDSHDELEGVFVKRWRNISLYGAVVPNFTFLDTMNEPPATFIIDPKYIVASTSIAMRPNNSSYNWIVHRPTYQVQGNGWHVDNWMCNMSDRAWLYRIVDPTLDRDIQIRWRIPNSPNEYYEQGHTDIISSMEWKCIDGDGNPVQGMKAIIKANDETIYNVETNEDGYFGSNILHATDDNGTIKMDVPLTDNRGLEYIITNKGKRFVADYPDGDNNDIIKIVWPKDIEIEAGDRLIEVPYVVWQVHMPKPNEGYSFSNIYNKYPFSITLRKYGYLDISFTADLKNPFNSSSVASEEGLTLTESEAADRYQHISIDYDTKTIATNNSVSLEELYALLRYADYQNIDKDRIGTFDGKTLDVSDWEIAHNGGKITSTSSQTIRCKETSDESILFDGVLIETGISPNQITVPIVSSGILSGSTIYVYNKTDDTSLAKEVVNGNSFIYRLSFYDGDTKEILIRVRHYTETERYKPFETTINVSEPSPYFVSVIQEAEL